MTEKFIDIKFVREILPVASNKIAVLHQEKIKEITTICDKIYTSDLKLVLVNPI